MKKKPTEPSMPNIGSRFISALSSPSRGISGGVSNLTSPSGTAGGWIRGCRLMMTTLTDALILHDWYVFAPTPPYARRVLVCVAADPTVTPESAARQERGEAGEGEENGGGGASTPRSKRYGGAPRRTKRR
jgi:hypothetical protein